MQQLSSIQDKIHRWLCSPTVDEESKNQIRSLEKENPKELYDAFYCNLEFGTGGLRGIMGVGDNRMNQYTVGKATQGFANYIHRAFSGEKKVIISFDSRNQSSFFAKITAQVFAANGIRVLLFKELRPTPELSFLLRHFQCQAGVMCTASHNPKEYNGYKAYWNDGSQLVPPHDKNVIAEVEAIPSFENVKWHLPENDHLIQYLDEKADQLYIQMVTAKTLHPEAIKQQADIRMVYTPIHGTGVTILPKTLETLGFKNVHVLEAQAQPDGNFPTVVYPNPEEKEAMHLALEKAKEINAEILFGTDPDSDRLAVAVRDENHQLELLNGNQLALLAFNYVIEETIQRHQGTLPAGSMIVKTIVSSPMIDVIAKHFGCTCYNVLTGFKWIAALIREKEGKEKFLIGGEESFGIMWGDECRDKDAISGAALFCEMAAYEKNNQSSIFKKLLRLYAQHGFYYETLSSITQKGEEGKKAIDTLMQSFRTFSQQEIAGSPLVCIKDYKASTSLHLHTKTTTALTLPKSDVLQFELEDGSLISARPSGTEPKIKFYFSVRLPFDTSHSYQHHVGLALEKIATIRASLNI